MTPNRRNIKGEDDSSGNQGPTPGQDNRAVQTIEFPTWLERVKTNLAEVEQRYDLAVGEMLVASNTSTKDLAELHSYGWTAAETSDSIIDRAGLR